MFSISMVCDHKLFQVNIIVVMCVVILHVRRIAGLNGSSNSVDIVPNIVKMWWMTLGADFSVWSIMLMFLLYATYIIPVIIMKCRGR